ncbi:MAG: dihydroorotase [Kiritimatiellae bacterium]|nr:dihydroorotase [Kiritimatiellia bacterium]
MNPSITAPAGRFWRLPGFIDVHVHFRDPGVPEAETRQTGAAAAVAGGFAHVVTMPNTTPAGDNVAWIREQIEDTALPVEIWPSACISKGRLGNEVADLEALAAAGAVAFTDDGAFVDNPQVMEAAMHRAAKLGIPVMQHAVVPALLAGGVMRDCAVARRFNLPVMPPAAEVEAVKRDIALVRVTGCALHIQHISCAETVALIRAAQKEGLPVSGEATPHHLLLSCDDIPADDANWKMAPPLGNREDVAAIREGVKDGTLALFATDHAPHPADKKAGGFRTSANGIIGLETAIPVTWKVMVEDEGMDPCEWARRWTTGPAALVKKPLSGVTTLDLEANRTVDPAQFKSLSRNQPYAGMTFKVWPTREKEA